MIADVRERESVVYEAVERAWTQTLPHTPFDPEMSWEDAGADSLKSLQLVMRLEEALERTIAYDVLSGQVTPRLLARRLAEDGAATVPGAADLPRVFLVPGIYGDAPALASLRAAFADQVTLELVDLPGLHHPIALLSDLDATVEMLADDIVRRSGPDEPISIMGWSFGGLIAVELAHRLREAGRVVAMLCMLDSFVGDQPATPKDDAARSRAVGLTVVRRIRKNGLRWLRRRVPVRRGETLRHYGSRLVFSALIRLDLLEAARRWNRGSSLPPEKAYQRHKILTGTSRKRAMKAWQPRPLPMPTFLIVTDDGMIRQVPDRWARYCPKLRVVHVPCNHLGALDPASLAVYKPEFVRAVHDVRTGEWR